MEPLVRVVVLNYNGGRYVLEAVASIAELEWPDDRLEVVVVDNASSDGSADALAARFPAVRMIRNERNTGFSANNLALTDLSSVDRIALVNPDAVVEPSWLRALEEGLAGSDDIGGVCPKMLLWDRLLRLDAKSTEEILVHAVFDGNTDVTDRCRRMWRLLGRSVGHDGSLRLPAGDSTLPVPVPPTWERGDLRLTVSTATGPSEVVIENRRLVLDPGATSITVQARCPPVDVVNNTGLEPRWLAYVADRGLGALDGPPFDRPAEVFGWSGGGVLLRSAFLADVGLFDERFFLYYEDVDLSWRGRARGWRFRFVPGAIMRHHHASSTGAGSTLFHEQNERNRLLAVTKNAPIGFVARCYLRFGISTLGYLRADVLRPVVRRTPPDGQMVLLRLRVLLSLVLDVRSLARSRREAQRRRTVPHDRLMGWFPRADGA